MTALTDEHLHALRFLAEHSSGCTEARLLANGFTAAQISQLVYVGLAKLRAVSGPVKFRVKITKAGQRATAE